MDNLVADFEINPNNPLNAEYEINEGNGFDCSFELFAAGTVWGSIDGNINNQTDLINLLNTKVDVSSFDGLSQTVTDNYNELSSNLTALTVTVGDNYTVLDGKISALSITVDTNYQTLDNRLDTAEDSILNLANTVSDNYTELNGKITTNADNITSINNTITNYGDIVTYDAAYFATANQGALADSALQPNDDITLLNNNAGYITSADLPTLEDLTTTAQLNAINSGATTSNIGQITTNTNNITSLSNTVSNLSSTVQSNYTILDNKIDTTESTLQGNIDTLSGTVTNNYNDLTQSITNNVSTLNTRITNEVSTLNGAITSEATTRQNADNNLQSQIDAITTASDVFDIVGTYAELQAYDISTVPVNDIIKVLVDSTHNNAATYYRCIETEGVKSWFYIGSEGAYYTKSEADGLFVEQTTTINNKPLSNNITLTASDIGALPNDTQIGNGTITLTQGGVTKGTFTLNQTGNATIDFDAGGSTITVDSALSTSSTNPVQNKVITTELNKKIESITLSDVTTALGYTPYDSTNPSGFITSSDLPTNYVTTDTAQDISGKKTFLGEKAIYFKQQATSNKLGFTLYDPNNVELGAFEYRPNTISGSALLNLNCPQTTGGYVGFRYWGSPAVNIVAPKVATAGNYFIPTHITNGNTTVTASNTGTVNISTLLPDVSNFVTNSSLSTTLSNYTLSSNLATVATSGNFDDLINQPTIPTVNNSTIIFTQGGVTKGTITLNQSSNQTIALDAGGGGGTGTVDQTYDSTSTNAQSGVAIAGARFLQNTSANASDSLTILGTPNSSAGAINIGYAAQTSAANTIAIGYYTQTSAANTIAIGGLATTSNDGAIAIGSGADAKGGNSIAVGVNAEVNSGKTYSIQIGTGTNEYSNLLQVWNYPLLSKTTGLIPDDRISSNIARTSQIPDTSSFVTNSSLSTTLEDYAETSDIPTAISDLTDDTSTTPIDKAESVVDQRDSSSLKYWTGTKAQYDAIATKDSDTIYNVEDTTSPIIDILNTLYPIGAIYIGTMATCPLSVLGIGTWQLVAQDRVLQGAGTRGTVGSEIDESLPNITGYLHIVGLDSGYTATGAFSSTTTISNPYAGHNSKTTQIPDIHFKASDSSSIYQDNAPVQQDGYLVNIWERIA